MAVQERTGETSLDRYISEVRAAWGDGKDPQLPFKVAALMEKLFASTSPDDPWMAELIGDGKPSRELYRDPELGFIQMGHIHKQGHGNKPHDHGPCWVVYGSYKGVTEITKYKRTDDRSQEGVAKLEPERLDRLTPGQQRQLILRNQALHAGELAFDWFGVTRRFACPPEREFRDFIRT